jgi:hypothetical protein
VWWEHATHRSHVPTTQTSETQSQVARPNTQRCSKHVHQLLMLYLIGRNNAAHFFGSVYDGKGYKKLSIGDNTCNISSTPSGDYSGN